MTKSRFAVSCSPGGDVFPSRSFLPAVPGLGGEGEPESAGARSDPAVGDPGGLLKRRSGLGRRARLPAGAPGRGRSLHAFDPLLLVPREGRTLGSVQWFLGAGRPGRPAHASSSPSPDVDRAIANRPPKPVRPGAVSQFGRFRELHIRLRRIPDLRPRGGSLAPADPRSSPDHCRRHGAPRPQAPSVRPAARSGPGPAPSPANGPTPGTEEAKRPRSRATAEHDSTPTSRTLIVFRYSPPGRLGTAPFTRLRKHGVSGSLLSAPQPCLGRAYAPPRVWRAARRFCWSRPVRRQFV
jgi:hypothetical protein